MNVNRREYMKKVLIRKKLINIIIYRISCQNDYTMQIIRTKINE